MQSQYKYKKLPPYGNILKAYQEDFVRLDFPLYIFVGQTAKKDAYQHKILGILCTYLPENEPYETFLWPVQGQKAIVCQSGKIDEEYLNSFVDYLYGFNPKVVFLFNNSIPQEILQEIINE